MTQHATRWADLDRQHRTGTASKRITVGYDGSPGARAAAEWALDEAVRIGASIHLLYVVEWPTHTVFPVLPVADPGADDEILDEATRLLAEAAERARATHPSVPVTFEAVRAGTVTTLRDRSWPTQLLVLGSRGHGDLAGALFGSVGVAVAGHTRCPLVVVRQPVRSRPAVAPVLVGVDHSVHSRHALAEAARMAARRGINLHVLHAVEPLNPLWNRSGADPTQAVLRTEAGALAETVRRLRERYPRLPISTEVVSGSPAEILEQGSYHVQLVVVGSHGRGGLSGLLLGSVSQHMLRHAHCPVMVVHDDPPGRHRFADN